MQLNRITWLRKLALPFFQKFNLGDISITHHYSVDKVKLHSFKHKGYWYHGKQREKHTLSLLQEVLKPKAVAIEVGGHIGYLSIFFARLVGDQGKVYVFEPGYNNLPYIKHNVAPIKHIELIEKAISNKNGEASFYVEDLTGQNNSLLDDYDTFNQNKEYSFVNVTSKEVKVKTITLDTYCKEEKIAPDFIKIDIEGAELLAVEGMEEVLAEHKPIIMIEITENKDVIQNIFKKHGYILYSDEKKELKTSDEIAFNTFCFHKDAHKNIIAGF
jgi:FkbM family methyltransferase